MKVIALFLLASHLESAAGTACDFNLNACANVKACHEVPGWNTQSRSLMNKRKGSVVHYDPVTNMIPRSDVAKAVRHAMDGEDNVEELIEVGEDTHVFDLTRNDMVVHAPNGLDDEFVVQNAFRVDLPDIVYKVECPAKSAGSVCQVEQLTASDGLDFCSLRDEDIPTKCMDLLYDVSLYAIKGPHFLVGVSPQEGGGVRGNECPQIIAFDTPDGQKKMLSLMDMGDIKGLRVHKLGSSKLGAILKAEEQADIIDGSNFDLVSNNCVHYARDIWSSLGFDETNNLALFITDHLMSDESFEKLAKKHIGGSRYVAAKTIGGPGAMEVFIDHVVYSQLDVVDV